MNTQNTDLSMNTDLATSPSQDIGYVKTPDNLLLFDAEMFNRVMHLSEIMATAKAVVPKHFHGLPGNCFAVIGQALRWGMDPFAVAQKTFMINDNGILAYEAQLVNAVVNTRAPVESNLQYEWFGPWDNLLGKTKKSESKSGRAISHQDWDKSLETQVGVTVSATLKGETQPRELTLLLAQAETRNSPLWVSDPRQQLAYLAAKRWARLHVPEVLLGVYTPDELENREMKVVNETPQPAKKSSGVAGLKQRLQERKTPAKKAEPETVEPNPADDTAYFEGVEALQERIENATSPSELKEVGLRIRSCVSDGFIDDATEEDLRVQYSNKKTMFDLIAKVSEANADNVGDVRQALFDNQHLFSQDEVQAMLQTLEGIAG
ncbi:hypothetical protein B0181_11520 [Moraxella caviae]|uniref:RecT family n=1 Tax=Moraxella caviae TaxID=34060 RepID=A0A1S9ZT89_9GAMM|nr:RecT family recombinase [Moraxella caviae]OOR86726.1 hypothetical protein B0181_11520 [Moraxella caviae]STZ13575.1 RecT family [Moraxella caviae]